MSIQLVQPTDFQILDALIDGRRDTAANLAVSCDKDRNYINTRLPVLAGEGFLQRIGPAENSGLYQITPRGVAAIQNRPVYNTNRDRFEMLLNEQASRILIEEPLVRQVTDPEETQKDLLDS